MGTDRRTILAFLGWAAVGGPGAVTVGLADDVAGLLRAASDDETDGASTPPCDCGTPTPVATERGGSAGPSGTDSRTTTESDPTHVELAADAELAERADGFQRALYDAGLDESITVEPLAGPRTTITRQTRYRQWFEAERREPTLLMMDSGWTMPFITLGYTQPLDGLDTDDTVTAIREAYLDRSAMPVTGPGGAIHGGPLFVDVPTVQYRKDLLREAGYGEPDFREWATDPPTWREFAEAVRAATDWTGTAYGFTFQAAEYEGLSCCHFKDVLASWGGACFGDPSEYLFGPVGERPITVDEQPATDALRTLRSFVHGPDADHALGGYPHISPERVLEWTEEPSRKPFTGGRAVALRNWPYSIGWLPPRLSLYDGSRVGDVGPVGRYLDTLAVAAENAVPRPASPVWGQESQAIGEEAHAALTGDKPPATATSDLYSTLREIERSYDS